MVAIAAAIGGSSLVSGASSLIGSGKSSSASKQAANESLVGTQMSIANEDNLYNRAVDYLSPYMNAGNAVLGNMQQIASATPAGVPYLGQSQNYQTQAGNYLQQAAGMDPSKVLTEAGLQQTPGYQFTQQQGLQATQAAAAARGLGVSGASLKGAATYATGLADATYSNRFNEAQQSWQDVMNQSTQAQNLGSLSLNQAATAQGMQNQQYNQYANIANLGENAASMSGQASTTTAGQISNAISSGTSQYGNYLSQAGQAQAAGTSGAGNALTSAAQNYLNYSNYQSLMNTIGNSQTGSINNLYGSGSGGATPGM